ncbi:alpha/beta fold hydrolase [Actinoallomurus iriomotensis]|uniref:Alpha/beta hydrolase n=1 Tax=Actinoallomurus iriomotensis TaxID=478107 RepID=A0A9W6W343_9ACTN|nr:alpha/beta hydrolase [Actinoallomurus iriomotensis]GLY89600.1 alpha/beta hydrolase [Actinoallomurus iriomotensis]
MSGYGKGEVRSTDGTTIGYRRWGDGPALILLHGGMLASQHLTGLAEALADDFTVYVPDRRGRGLSGGHGDDYGVEREVEDVRALVAETGANRIFGLSSGGLVALRTALAVPELERIALYEPPLDAGGAMPLGWLPRYERELAAGRTGAALVTVLKGMEVEPVFGRVPRFVLTPLMAIAVRMGNEPSGDEVPVKALVPTQGFDIRLVQEMADTAQEYASVPASVLLLGGARSPAYLRAALSRLAAVLPHARSVTFPRLDHSGPTNDGDPLAVADALRDFFTADPGRPGRPGGAGRSR